MLNSLFTEADLRGMATQYSSRLLMAEPSKVFEAMFEAIRAERQHHAKIFGNYDSELNGTPAQWVEWAQVVGHAAGYHRLAYELKNLFASIESDAVTDMLREKSSTPPEGVPEGYLMRAVDANGYNIGLYTFIATDRHFWLPPEEARKERPDLSKGFDNAPFKAQLEQKNPSCLVSS